MRPKNQIHRSAPCAARAPRCSSCWKPRPEALRRATLAARRVFLAEVLADFFFMRCSYFEGTATLAPLPEPSTMTLQLSGQFFTISTPMSFGLARIALPLILMAFASA